MLSSTDHHASFIMEICKIWLLLVHHDLKATGPWFSVKVDISEQVDELKNAVKKKSSKVFSSLHVDSNHLTVWKTKGEMVINNLTSAIRMAEILESIHVDDVDVIEQLDERALLRDLELPDGQILLVRLPGNRLGNNQSLGNINSKVVENSKYKNSFLRAMTKGKFTADDVTLNEINPKDPKFVKDLENSLSRKRKLDHDMSAAAKKLVRERTFKAYFTSAAADSSQPGPDQFEVGHLVQISLIPAGMWDTPESGTTKPFKEGDANWLFFLFLARHFESLGEHSNFVVKLGAEPWPFKLIVKVDGISDVFYTYRPKNSFLLLKCGLPRVAVEVNSILTDRPPADHIRLMLQGASIVRFANAHLDAYKKGKTFVFVAIFITAVGQANRYFLYQKRDPWVVYAKMRSFKFADETSRAKFALEMYNLSTSLDDGSESDTKREVNKLLNSIDDLDRAHKLPTFTGKDTVEQLETCGYEVVLDVLETEGGTWESISRLPPQIRTVYRRRDPKKIELIAKHVREGSDELEILKYLRSIRPQSVHVISLIDAIPPITSPEWLILPKLHSIDQWLMNRGGDSGRVRLGWGLIKGLAYLHEHQVAHRDVKPDNLVCDDNSCLQVIDFDVAIKVQDENAMIDEYRGTENWTAPEMGKQDGPTPMYSPIKADRWSCGRVLLYHIMVGKGDKLFSNFADQLIANDPQQRPSLLEWHKFLIAPPSDGPT